MVKKIIAVWAIVVVIVALYGDYITKQPLEIPVENGENDVNQEVVEEKLVVAVAQSSISPYDPIFQEVCREYGNDWRLMSAMAYHESRFRPDVTSSQGALGMMQVMPRVAEHFNVESEDLTDVETNIMVANLLVNSIIKMLKLNDDSIPERDRLALILASYNGGVGYVLHARKLARRNGESVTSWDIISQYLRQMSDEEFALENDVKHFRGVSQTMAYVKNVIGHYDHYRQIAVL